MKKQPLISKSSFIKGNQCLKALYLSKKHPEFRDEISEGQQAIFDRGHNVGELAQQLFPGGVLAAFDLPEGFMRSIRKTRELIDQGATIIYEAGILVDNTHCFVDILVKEEGKWHIYEVKSSTSISDTYILDAAFQYYVLSKAGLEIADVSIIYINNQYVRNGDLDIQELFISESVFEKVKEQQDFVKQKIAEQADVLFRGQVPGIDIAPHCFSPYTCDFMGYCWKDVPEYSVFNISRLNINDKFSLYDNGIVRIEDIPDDYPLTDSQQIQVRGEKEKKVIIDKPAIRQFLDSLKYSLYFLDFETIFPAIPLYDRSRPYQQIVFQYSMHYLEKPGASLQHFEFLSIPPEEPRIAMMDSLIRDIGDHGDILVYNISFERSRLNEIARDFPQYEVDINRIISRMKDLMFPFQQKQYYTPQMKGSYSIKSVLPALSPNFSYDKLDIKEGGMASAAFEKLMQEKDPDTISKIRTALLEYCKMDTMAMVEVLKVLER